MRMSSDMALGAALRAGGGSCAACHGASWPAPLCARLRMMRWRCPCASVRPPL